MVSVGQLQREKLALKIHTYYGDSKMDALARLIKELRLKII